MNNNDFKNDNPIVCPFEATIDAIIKHSELDNTEPTFYYLAVGSANFTNRYPDPNLRHELPDYVDNYDYGRKVLILIDPMTKDPLHDYPNYTLVPQIKTEFYERYISAEPNKFGDPKLEVNVIRKGLYIDLVAYAENKPKAEIIAHRQFLVDVVSYALLHNPDSMFLVGVYFGANWYHLQDDIINMFDPDIQADVRGRFLIDSRYFNDLGCYYDLVDPKYQPIIINKRFFNMGMLSPIEFNHQLKLIKSSNQLTLDKKRLIFDYLGVLFSRLINHNLNEDYRNDRVQYTETKDDELKKYHRDRMLSKVKTVLSYIRDFIPIDQILADLQKSANVYNDGTLLREVFNNVCRIVISGLDNDLANGSASSAGSASNLASSSASSSILDI